MDIPIHVIDFEGSRGSGIVEYGVVTLRGPEIQDAVTRFCAPVGTITDEDRRRHRISEDEAGQERPFHADWEYFATLREHGPFCAHNSVVENGLLRLVWSYPRRSPDFSEPGAWVASWGPWLDTLYLYRRIYPQLQSYRLKDLIHLFSLQKALDQYAVLHCPPARRSYHCALYDALASALLLQHLDLDPDLPDISLLWLLRQSAASESTRTIIGQQELF